MKRTATATWPPGTTGSTTFCPHQVHSRGAGAAVCCGGRRSKRRAKMHNCVCKRLSPPRGLGLRGLQQRRCHLAPPGAQYSARTRYTAEGRVMQCVVAVDGRSGGLKCTIVWQTSVPTAKTRFKRTATATCPPGTTGSTAFVPHQLHSRGVGAAVCCGGRRSKRRAKVHNCVCKHLSPPPRLGLRGLQQRILS